MRFVLPKKYGNGVLFHKAVSNEYQNLNKEKMIDQTFLKDTSGLIPIICHNNFAYASQLSNYPRCVALSHHDARVGGTVPGLGSFNTVTLASNNGSPYW